MRQYYHYVDHHEFDKAVELFTEDVTWEVMGIGLTGRDEILEALYGGLGNDTIRARVDQRNRHCHRQGQRRAKELHDELLLSREGRKTGYGRPAPLWRPASARRHVREVETGWRRIGRLPPENAGGTYFGVRTNLWPWKNGPRRRVN